MQAARQEAEKQASELEEAVEKLNLEAHAAAKEAQEALEADALRLRFAHWPQPAQWRRQLGDRRYHGAERISQSGMGRVGQTGSTEERRLRAVFDAVILPSSC